MAVTAESRRVRRSPEQLIADLQAKIEAVKRRAAQQKVKKSPALRHMSAALKSIDKALGETNDAATRQALTEVRTTIAAALGINGAAVSSGVVKPSGGRRSSQDVANLSERLLDYVSQNPGQRGEEIASALDTDTATMRLPMRKLIADKKVKTQGEKRGMRYYPR